MNNLFLRILIMGITSLMVSSCAQQSSQSTDGNAGSQESRTAPVSATEVFHISSPTARVESPQYGIDISNAQGLEIENLNLEQAKLSFIICKATAGRDFEETTFVKNWPQIKDLGLVRGAYHFYFTRWEDTPEHQAKFFVETVRAASNSNTFLFGSLPFVLDFEEKSIVSTPGRPDKSIAQVQEDLHRFLFLVDSLSGKTPIIYTNHWGVTNYLNDTSFTKYPLWYADPVQRADNNFPYHELPPSWQENGQVLIWQRSWSDTLDGQVVNDFDWFLGDKSQLEALAQ